MNHNRRSYKTLAVLTLFVVSILTIFFAASFAASPSKNTLVLASLHPSTTLENTDELLQFAAGGHVLGFASNEMYIASVDHALKVVFANANPVKPVIDETRSVHSDGRTRGKHLDVVTYLGLWDGVDLIYEGGSGGLVKSTYRIAAGIHPSQLDAISLRYNIPVQKDSTGGLLLAFNTGQLRESAPIAWQEIDGKQLPVDVGFRILGEREVGFRVGTYDPAFPLIIDPTLTWHTFIGSTSSDDGWTIAVDNTGNIYVAGESAETWGSPINPYAGGSADAFVSMLNSDGALQWNTFMGGTLTDTAHGIFVDGSGNVYVTGSSSATWGSPIDPHLGSAYDCFVAKLNNSGVLQWNTFMGGIFTDDGYGIAVDGFGNAYVTGYSESTWGSPVNGFAGGGDAFTAKLNSSGNRLWHTFMGSVNYDYAKEIVLDAAGNAYVTGVSNNTWGTPVNAYSGGTDGFATKLNSSGVRQWNTFMGSEGLDYGYGIALDGSDNIYVIGESDTTWSTPISAHSGASYDTYVAKLNNSGVQVWNTFLGPSSYYSGWGGVAVDISGNVCVTESSDATWGSPDNPHAGGYDAFMAVLNSSGVYQWNTFMGSTQNDYGRGIAADGDGNVYVVGSGDDWLTPLSPHMGGDDAFVAKFSTGNTISFQGAVNYPAGDGPGSVAIGDLNEDGFPDLATANSPANNGYLFFGNGDGTFQAAVSYTTGNYPRKVAIRDLNDDNHLDLITCNGFNSVSILLGIGDGTFQTAVNYPVTNFPIGMDIADLNGDDILDIATVDFNQDKASVLLGNGDGTFQAEVTYVVADGPYGVAIGDFNTDTYPDLAVVNGQAYNVSILLGNGDGTFQAAVNYDTGAGPWSLDAADLNGDTFLDLAVSNGSGDDISILLGNGDGTFQAAVNFGAGASPRTLVIEDMNKDGDQDLVVANWGDDNVSLLVGNGDGTFQAAINFAAGVGTTGVAVDDLNGDGQLDIAASNNNGDTVSVLLSGSGSERDDLIDLYNSTDGGNWTNNTGWLVGDECTWFGITCDVSNNVTEINLSSNNLNGTIPAGLQHLSHLQALDLGYNQLTGSIPFQLGNLSSLTVLYLASNQLAGSIPPELGNLENLIQLNFDTNQLTGSIPFQLGNLLNLTELDIEYNQLSGEIPPELGNLESLTDLELGQNRLTGSIPTELGSLSNLQYIDLAGNQLSGSIPDELTNLTNLWNDSNEFRWNALYTSNPALKAFLDTKQLGNDWEGTQTIDPTNLTAGSPTNTSITLTWTAIPYTADSGGYGVGYSTTSGGPYTLFENTVDKAVTSSTVTGLMPGTTYYFVLETYTNSHANNQNKVFSEHTGEVSGTTTAAYNLSINISGQGSVALSPSGGIYDIGTEVTLTAIPTFGWAFSSWSGVLSGSANPITITMNANKAVTATFVENQPPDPPIVEGPEDESVIGEGAPVLLNAGAYHDPDGDAHKKSHWKVWRFDNSFIVYEESTSIDKEQLTLSEPLDSGLKYEWMVEYEDAAGKKSASEIYTFKVGTSVAEALPVIEAGKNLGDFGMISIVHWPNDPDPLAVFNIDYDPNNYRIGAWDPEQGHYIEFGEGLEMEPGRAVWILTRDPLVVNFNGIPVSTEHDLEVCLHTSPSTDTGWNMIAPPNDKDYHWKYVMVGRWLGEGHPDNVEPVYLFDEAAADLVDQRIWEWNDGAYTSYRPEDNFQLKRYKGYWVRADVEGAYLIFTMDSQVANLSMPAKMWLAVQGKTAQWLKNLMPATHEAIADSDSPPMPMGLFEDNVDPVFEGCFIETVGE